MNRNLLIKELKGNLKGSIIISIILAFYISFSVWIYSTMEENMEAIIEIYSTIPKFLREAMNFQMDQWTSILGFYSTYFIFYVPLALGCYSIIFGGRILSIEEHHKTAEFLLSRPLSRKQIVSSKLMALFIHIFAINLLIYLVGMIACGLVSDWAFSIMSFSILQTYGMLICLFFGVLGFFITVVMKRAKSNIGVGIGIVLGAYFFDMILRVSNKLSFLLYITPFKYIDLETYRQDYHFEFWRLIILIGSTLILIWLSFVFYRKKDILV